MRRSRAVDLVAQLAGDREPADPGADQPDIHRTAAHERQGLVAHVLVGQRGQHAAGFRPGQ